ncbi:interleukin-1 receptor-associated kinase 1-binding protein 1 homolog isoform X2 [Rhincodon typus]|uniref:interleukin-1 receptor-associated kinase 1-binding protein 1 homolog isoform X2 n=1 Tax=Rhincodon typus TaxID=259920 RepID=UPI00202FFE15|nr:interleukin-1 receptor-associated kinase 1-binding protein 1 homolog isoform X2 [Rhincodon typus]
MAISPAQVFATLLSDTENGKRCWPERRGSKSPVPSPSPSAEREVQVSATAEVSAPPNRARVCVLVASRKEAAAAAKSSVSRRLEYIVQSVRAHGVRVSVIFNDFSKMENCCNLLVEKLDSSVVVGSPQFYHTTEAVESIRRQACLRAVANSRRKAFEVCRLLGQTLGRPLIVREEEIKETEGLTSEAQAPDNTRPLTIQQQISNASVTVCSKVFVTFELKSKDNLKRNN